MSDRVTISQTASVIPYGIKLVAEKQYTVEDLLKATIIRSSNNAAYALAEYVSGGNVTSSIGRKDYHAPGRRPGIGRRARPIGIGNPSVRHGIRHRQLSKRGSHSRADSRFVGRRLASRPDGLPGTSETPRPRRTSTRALGRTSSVPPRPPRRHGGPTRPARPAPPAACRAPQ